MSGWAFVLEEFQIRAEYIVTSNGSGLDQRSSLDELGVVPSIVDLIPMYWDNNARYHSKFISWTSLSKPCTQH